MQLTPVAPINPSRSDAIHKPYFRHLPLIKNLLGQYVFLENRGNYFPNVVRVVGRLTFVHEGSYEGSPTIDLVLLDGSPYTCKVNDLNWIEAAGPLEPDD